MVAVISRFDWLLIHIKHKTQIMLKTISSEKEMMQDNAQRVAHLSRRKFFGFAGAASAVMLLACNKNNDDSGVNLGSGDTGILNYAYALEQLEAAFYTKVVQSFYTGATTDEKAFLTDIRDHEIAHREFFKSVLGNSKIQDLEVDFSSINFTSRDSVLGTAKSFEDLGVSAYDGAGYLIKDAGTLLLAGKIVSVEARHAALIRELIAANTFLGDQVDGNSVNISRTPMEVLAIAGTYIKTKINASNLPTG
jgi:rubrerythrin